MNPTRHLGLALLAGLALNASALAGTPNTVVGGAVSYEVGHGWVSQAIDESAQERWFTFREVGARSYCIEASLGVATYYAFNPSVTLYADTTLATQLGTNDDGAGEPPMHKGARYCYVSPITVSTGVPTSTIRAVRVSVPVVAGSGDAGFVRMRVVDTTLISHRTWASWEYSLANTGTTNVTGAFFAQNLGKRSGSLFSDSFSGFVSGRSAVTPPA